MTAKSASGPRDSVSVSMKLLCSQLGPGRETSIELLGSAGLQPDTPVSVNPGENVFPDLLNAFARTQVWRPRTNHDKARGPQSRLASTITGGILRFGVIGRSVDFDGSVDWRG